MVVGEPTLMGGEFGDEDERLITRLENNQYEPNTEGEDLNQPPNLSAEHMPVSAMHPDLTLLVPFLCHSQLLPSGLSLSYEDFNQPPNLSAEHMPVSVEYHTSFFCFSRSISRPILSKSASATASSFLKLPLLGGCKPMDIT